MKEPNGIYIQFGCGYSAPEGWINFDISPTLRLQKIPLLGDFLRNRMIYVFPRNARYGDIVKGLPLKPGTCQGIYCSHVLEHLALEDFRLALRNTYSYFNGGRSFPFGCP